MADVVTALAMELLKSGHRVTLLFPGYRCQEARGVSQVVMRFSISKAGRMVEVTAEEELVWFTETTHPPWRRSARQYIDLYWSMKRGKTKG
ncbi:MAG: hypothetical protein HC938_02185 [Nitrospira sp.]|nr:hypothetical protein [Nitrospira sp.]